MKIEYRLKNGFLMSYDVQLDSKNLLVSDLDALCQMYERETGLCPEFIFVEFNIFIKFIKKAIRSVNTYDPIASNRGLEGVRFAFCCGAVSVVPLMNPHTPIFVGSREEYDNNDIDKAFEEIVLKDCERE